MRILVITKYYHPVIGGVETLVRTLAEHHVLEGHECTVVCMDPSKDSDEIVNGVRVIRFHRQGHAVTGIHLGIREWLMRNATPDKYDIANVHNFHSPQALMAAYYCHSQGLPFVFTTHYHGHGQSRTRDVLFQIYRVYGGNIYRWSEKNICVSNFEKDLVQGDFDLPDDSIAIVPNGGRDFQNMDVARQGSILYVGRLVKYKGVDHILSAMAILKGQGRSRSSQGGGLGAGEGIAGGQYPRARIRWSGGLARWHQRGTAQSGILQGRRPGAVVGVGGLRIGGCRGIEVRNAMHRGQDIGTDRVHIGARLFRHRLPPDPKELSALIEKVLTGGIKVGPLSDKLISWQQVSDRYLVIYEAAIKGYRAGSKKDSDRPPFSQSLKPFLRSGSIAGITGRSCDLSWSFGSSSFVPHGPILSGRFVSLVNG